MTRADPRPELPGVFQKPDPDHAERRVRELQESAARLSASLERTAEITQELEDIMGALAVARIDLEQHRAQRRALDGDQARRRVEEVIRQRREVVALFEDSERAVLEGPQDDDDDDARGRLEAIRADLRVARANLERALAERDRLRGSAAAP